MRNLSVVFGLVIAGLVSNLAGAAASGAGGLQQVGKFPEQTIDTDHDGIADIDDNCPATPATQLLRGKTLSIKVDGCGCPIDPCITDVDQDGIDDCKDLCPATARGLRVGATGCPVPQRKPQTFALDVKFAFAEANLQERYVPDLDQLRVLLLRFPELKVTMEGHTDGMGSARYNQALSQARANKCRKYLLSDPRIDGSRVRAIGYGKSRPASNNRDDVSQARNRRTVVTLDYLYEFTPPNSGKALPP